MQDYIRWMGYTPHTSVSSAEGGNRTVTSQWPASPRTQCSALEAFSWTGDNLYTCPFLRTANSPRCPAVWLILRTALTHSLPPLETAATVLSSALGTEHGLPGEAEGPQWGAQADNQGRIATAKGLAIMSGRHPARIPARLSVWRGRGSY